jgi:hypothetical protein
MSWLSWILFGDDGDEESNDVEMGSMDEWQRVLRSPTAKADVPAPVVYAEEPVAEQEAEAQVEAEEEEEEEGEEEEGEEEGEEDETAPDPALDPVLQHMMLTELVEQVPAERVAAMEPDTYLDPLDFETVPLTPPFNPPAQAAPEEAIALGIVQESESEDVSLPASPPHVREPASDPLLEAVRERRRKQKDKYAERAGLLLAPMYGAAAWHVGRFATDKARKQYLRWRTPDTIAGRATHYWRHPELLAGMVRDDPGVFENGAVPIALGAAGLYALPRVVSRAADVYHVSQLPRQVV